MTPMSTPPQNPFPGSSPLPCGGKLGGREQARKLLQRYIHSFRVVLLHGPSGAGKSSLVNAGFVAEQAGHFGTVLRFEPSQPGTDAIPVPQPGTAGSLRWQPVESGAAAHLLAPWTGAAENSQPDTEWFGHFAVQKLVTVTAGAIPAEELPLDRTDKPPLLIFDGFEVMLTRPREELLKFFVAFELFLQSSHSLPPNGSEASYPTACNIQVYALLVLRSSYLGHLEPWRRRVPGALKASVELQRMNRKEARDAIIARDAGDPTPLPQAKNDGSERPEVRLSAPRLNEKDLDSVVDHLIKRHVRGDSMEPSVVLPEERESPIEPLHLSIICRKLWQERETERNQKSASPKDYSSEYEHWLSEFIDEAIDGAVRQVITDQGDTLANTLQRGMRLWAECALMVPVVKDQPKARSLGFVGDEPWKICLRLDAKAQDSVDPLSKKAQAVLPFLERRGLLSRLTAGDREYWQLTHRRLSDLLYDSNRLYFAKNADQQRLLPGLLDFALEHQVPYGQAWSVVWSWGRSVRATTLDRLRSLKTGNLPMAREKRLAVERSYLRKASRKAWLPVALIALPVLIGAFLWWSIQGQKKSLDNLETQVKIKSDNAARETLEREARIKLEAFRQTKEAVETKQSALTEKDNALRLLADTKKQAEQETEQLTERLRQQLEMTRRFLLDPNVRLPDRERVKTLIRDPKAPSTRNAVEREVDFRFQQQTLGLKPWKQIVPDPSSLYAVSTRGEIAELKRGGQPQLTVYRDDRKLWAQPITDLGPGYQTMAVSPTGSNVLILDGDTDDWLGSWLREGQHVPVSLKDTKIKRTRPRFMVFLNEDSVIIVGEETIVRLWRKGDEVHLTLLASVVPDDPRGPRGRHLRTFKSLEDEWSPDDIAFTAATLLESPPAPTNGSANDHGATLCLLVRADKKMSGISGISSDNSDMSRIQIRRYFKWMDLRSDPTAEDVPELHSVDTKDFTPYDLRVGWAPPDPNGSARREMALLGYFSAGGTSSSPRVTSPPLAPPEQRPEGVPSGGQGTPQNVALRWWSERAETVENAGQIRFNGDANYWHPYLLYASRSIVGVQYPNGSAQFGQLDTLPLNLVKKGSDSIVFQRSAYLWSFGSGFTLADPPPALVSLPDASGTVVLGSPSGSFYRYNPRDALPYRLQPEPSAAPTDIAGDLLALNDKPDGLTDKSPPTLHPLAMLSPNGSWLAVAESRVSPGSAWSAVTLRNLRSSKEWKGLQTGEEKIHRAVGSLAFDQGSGWLVAGCDGGVLRLFSVPPSVDGEMPATLQSVRTEASDAVDFPLSNPRDIHSPVTSLAVCSRAGSGGTTLLVFAGMKNGEIRLARFEIVLPPPGGDITPRAKVSFVRSLYTVVHQETGVSVDVTQIMLFHSRKTDRPGGMLILAGGWLKTLQFPGELPWSGPEDFAVTDVSSTMLPKGLKAKCAAAADRGIAFAIVRPGTSQVEVWSDPADGKGKFTLVDSYAVPGGVLPTVLSLIAEDEGSDLRVFSGGDGPGVHVSSRALTDAGILPNQVFYHPPLVSPRLLPRVAPPPLPAVADMVCVPSDKDKQLVVAIFQPSDQPGTRQLLIRRVPVHPLAESGEQR